MLINPNHNFILHYDLDTFFVSVERLLNSSYVGKPLLIGGTSDRGVVASCSYEARQFGVHNGMSMKIARRLCPHAIAIRGDAGVYSRYSKTVTEILRENTPLLEKASVDEFYVDMTGMDKIFGVDKFSKELREKIIRETGLPISMGLSENKTVSKVATSESKPSGRMVVDYGREKDFLAPLSIRKLPMVGNETYQILTELGVSQIGIIQQMPKMAMEKVLGKNGLTLWDRAQGIDLTPVKPFYERESLSVERTFHKDTIDMNLLNDMITAMSDEIAYELRNGDKLTACISVKVTYSDMQRASKQKTIPYTSLDHTILSVCRRLFADLYSRRQLIRLVGVTASHLVSGGHQMNLLEDSVELIQLYHEMDYLKNKYRDSKLVTRASTIHHRNLGMGDVWNGEPPTPGAHRHA